MNHIYRVVWNAAKGLWQAVSEIGSGRIRSTSSRARRRKAFAAAALVTAGTTPWAAPLPTGAQVVAGQASVSYAGTGMTVNQSSQKAALDWSSFSIGQGHTVTFVQPSAASVALNRVIGADPSVIQGALNANGHVFLLNPNGVLFSPTAQVNVGGLLASTLGLRTDDFLAGRYDLSGTSMQTVSNQGTIAAAGGNVALVAARVINDGTVAADRGNVLLGAGSNVLVDFGGPVKLQIKKGALDARIENGGALRADGGTVLLTAKSADALTGSVINNTGIVQARTLSTGARGQILLLGDMESGTLHAGGTLDTSAPVGGDGGAIETSAAHVDTAANLVVKAGAAAGKSGEWLVDPYNYTIGQTEANTIVAALNQGTNVSISTQAASSTAGSGSIAGTSGSGDITVNNAIAKTAGGEASLTLRADRNITVNAPITSTSGKLNLTLSSANAAGATTGGVNVNGNLSSNGGNILIGGGNGSANGGIAYALNTSATTAAVTIGSGKSILSGGGDITINGRSLVGSNSGSLGGNDGGVYIRAGATINTGSGNLLVNGESDGGIKTFGLAFEGGSNTVTALGSSAGGTMLLNGVNVSTGNGITQADRDEGAVGLVAYGSRDQIVFQGASVAGWLIYVNGAPQLSAYTQAPQLSSCPPSYPNCGTMVIPGSNNSYLYATYQAVDMATHALYITQSGTGTKVYDGTRTATGLTYGVTTDIAGFSVSNLTPTPVYVTPSKNVGNYTKLVAGTTNPTSYTTGGTRYAVGYFNTGSYSITPKALSPSAASKVYDGNTTAAVSVSGAIAGDAVTASGTGTFGSKNVGSYNVSIGGITLGGADAGNYTLSGTSASAMASITPRPVTLTGSKTYDGSASFSSVAIGNLVTGESLTATGVTSNSANVAGASYFNAATLADGDNGLAGNYQLPSLASASMGNAAAITPRALSITGLSALGKTYDGTTSVQLSGGTLAGLVGSETLNIGAITGAFASKDVGTGKAVTLSNVALSDATGLASNYTVAQPSGITGSVTAKALSVSGMTATDKVYDGSTGATVDASHVVLTGLVNGDAVTVGVTGAFADQNAGRGKTVALTSTHGGADVGNYTITDQATTTAAITPKSLTVTGMTANSKVYDGTTAATLAGGILSGLVGGETLTVSGGTGVFANANAGTNKAVTVSGIALANGTGLASNYAVAQPAGVTGTITPRALTIIGLAAADKVYDGTTSAVLTGGMLSGLVGNETLVVTGGAGVFADKNVGTNKSVTIAGVGLANGSGLATNYTVAQPANVTASITPKALTVSGITASNKIYDGAAGATLDASHAVLAGLVNGDRVTVGATGTFADSNAGNGKTVALTSTYGGADASNYAIADQATTSASITPKVLTVTGIAAADKAYDGTTTATLSGGTLSGLVGSETLSITGGTGRFADANAGTNKAVTIAGVGLADGSGLAANYTVAQPAGVTASITPKAVTVTGMAAADKTYDGTTFATLSGGTLSGLVGNETLSITGSAGRFADANAGTNKAVSIAGVGLADGSGLAANYTVAQPAGVTASITPKALTITGMAAVDKVYDGTTEAALSGGTLSGLVGNDTLGVAGGTGVFADKNVGTNKIVSVHGIVLADGTGLSSNYTVAQPAGVTGSITPKGSALAASRRPTRSTTGAPTLSSTHPRRSCPAWSLAMW